MTDPSPTRDTLLDESSDRDERSEAALERGTVVGRYIVLEKVGAGGMGVVYAAFDPDLDRRVALKLVQPRRSNSSDAITRMLREAQALARLSHPNVVAVHDVGEARGGVFLAMEFVRGETFARWRHRAKPTWREVLDVMAAAGRGLAAAHDKGLVHRDVKPDNIMIDEDGRVRVMDFGLARPSDDTSRDDVRPPSGDDERPWSPALGSALTNDGAIIGTVGYMAPEQFGGGSIGAPTDQFAYCVTLWEALYGRRPFAAPTFEAMAIAVAGHDVVPPPRTTEVPAWVHKVLVRGLAADPAARWPSMRALLDALAADPGPRRTRWIVAAVATGVALTGITALRVHSQRRRSACADAAAAIAQHWSPQIAETVRSGIERSGVADPEAAFARTVPWLDRYAESWSSAASEVCVAATIEQRFDADLHTRAQDCLAERAAELDELVRLLESPSADAVREAIASASALTPVASCRDADQLAWSPVVGDERRADATAVRQLLARASIARSMGDPDAGLTQAEAALDAAQALELDHLIARAHLEIGAACVERDEGPRAEVELRTAYRLAAAAGVDEVAADAARRLVFATGFQLERHDASELWYEVAEAALDRMHVPPEDARRAALMSERASVRSVSGRIREARDDFEAVLANDIARLGEDHPEVVTVLAALSATYYQLDDHVAAEHYATRALDVMTRVLGEDHPERALVLSGYAAVLQALHRRDEAIAAARSALSIQERAFGSKHPAVAGALNNLAMMLGPTDEAMTLLRRALVIIETARGPEHREVAYCLNNLGHLGFLRGEVESAIADHERAAAILSATERPDGIALSQTLYNLGVALEGHGEAQRAVAAFERALPIASSAFGEEHAFVAVVHGAIGRARLKTGDRAGAVAALETAMARHEKVDNTPADVARDRMHLARARWEMGGDVDVARREIEAALAMFEEVKATKQAEVARAWLDELSR